MSDGIGLSVGASNLAAVIVGRAAVTRTPVLTRYPHRPPEVGVPGENPNLGERGLIISDFVDRVGDPVGIVAADGSTHRADTVLAEALRAMLLTLGGGRAPAGPVAVTHPAHWRPAAVEALRTALAGVPEFSEPTPAPLISDATAALTALQNDPGVPARGVIALCDFGGSGTSITLVDAANGYTPVAPTIRHTDFSGDLVDQALLTRVINDLSAAGTIDLTGTSAIGSLSALRSECRAAKERLSTSGVTALTVEVPGHRSEARLTRNELDEAIRQPLAEFVGVLEETLERNGIRGLACIATVGGGAAIPIITTTLSERLRVPVVTAATRPDLTAAIGGGLAAVRGTVEEGKTAMAPMPPAAAASAAAAAAEATAMAPQVPGQFEETAQSSTFRALAWSDADDTPEVAPTDHYDYEPPAAADDGYGVRPEIQFRSDRYEEDEPPPPPLPWYRRPEIALGAGVLGVLAALVVAAVFMMSGDDATPTPASTTEPIATTAPTTSAAPPPPPETQAPPPATQAPPPRTVYQPRPPVTQTVTAPPPSPEPPPVTTEEPPPVMEDAEPLPPEPPPTQPTVPTIPPLIPELPYETIPGLPFVPHPIQPQPPGP